MYRGTYSAPKYLTTYYNYNKPTAPVPAKYPEDIECIIKSAQSDKGNLYLSNVEAAENVQTVKKLKIGAILTCAKGYMVDHPKYIVPHYKYIAGQDKESFDISLHFQEAVEFIKDTLAKTNIIVHCIAGVSRSVSMVIAYFIKYHNMSYHQAYNTVKSKRKIISPNQGFIQQLKIYEQKMNSKGSFSGENKQKTGQFYTPKKGSINQQAQTNDKTVNIKSDNQDQYSQLKRNYTTDSFYQHKTPNFKKSDNIQNYQRYSKSMSFIPDRELVVNNQQKDDLINIKVKDYSPRKALFNNYTQKQRYTRPSGQKSSGYFDAMNKQLNDKIEAIRQKYVEQREQMVNGYNKRGYSTTNVSSNKNINQPASKNHQFHQNRQKSPNYKQHTQKNQRSQYPQHYYKNQINQSKKYNDFVNSATKQPKSKYRRYDGVYGSKYSKYDYGKETTAYNYREASKYNYGKQYNKYDMLYQKRDVPSLASGQSAQIYRRIFF